MNQSEVKRPKMESSLRSKIDYTILRPDATEEEVFEYCKTTVENGYASVCVNPVHVREIRRFFENIRICTVISFPYGAHETSFKMGEITKAIYAGADEVDIVMNLGLLKSGKDIDRFKLQDQIRSLSKCAKNNNNTLIKIIVEACLWEDKDLTWLIKVCDEAKIDYIKTSTGTHKYDITIDQQQRELNLKHWVSLWNKERETRGYKIKIKASGGIRTKEFAKELIEAGADRIGTSTEL